MTGHRQLRSGGRRPRLSDAETERRMLAAGARFVEQHGFSLSLEHLSMEDLIHAAGVSRTSSYRRWPTKDLYAADLLLSLARATEVPADIAGLPEALAALAADPPGDPVSPEGRHELFVELLRVTFDADFRAAAADPAWRTFTMLRAAYLGFEEGETRDAVADALRETERTFSLTRATAMRTIAEMFGLRLRQGDEQGWRELSLTLGALNTGMLIRAFTDPRLVEDTREAAPFGVRRRAPWPAHALAGAAILLGALEPDPDVRWDAERVDQLRALLADPSRSLAQWLVDVRAEVARASGDA